MQPSNSSSSRDEAWKKTSSNERGDASFSPTPSQKEPSRTSSRRSSGAKDGRHSKRTTASSAVPYPSHSYSRVGNGSLTTPQNNGMSSLNGCVTSPRSSSSSGGGNVGKWASLTRRFWQAVWRPTFLYCAGFPMLVPSAILTGILFAFEPFSALHAIALVLLLLSLLLIALASILLCWIYRHRPPSGKELKKKQNKDAEASIDAAIATPRNSRVTSDRGGSSDATQPTSSLYVDSRSRKSKHKKNKRHSKAAIPQLGRITESVQEEEPPSIPSAWGEKPPRPPSTRKGHKPSAESAPPPQSQLLPLICLPRACGATPYSVVDEAKCQNVASAEPGARLSRRRSLSDLDDNKHNLVQEYIQHLAAMETTPDNPEGSPRVEIVPSNSHSEKKKRGHQRSKSHGKMTSEASVVDFAPKTPKASGSELDESGPM